jgi:hypothetical protein
MRATLGALILCACWSAPDEMNAPGPNDDLPKADPQQPGADPHIVCDASKFSFTQQVGCANDGWVEFCAEKAGAPVVSQLRAISPDLSIYEGMIGHAGCNESTDYLVSQPLQASDCMQQHGALTDAAWNTLCALSQVPQTKHFVPGFAE